MQHLLRYRASPITAWADGLTARPHVNVAAVAMSNKMARMAWAGLTKGGDIDRLTGSLFLSIVMDRIKTNLCFEAKTNLPWTIDV